MGLRRLGKRIVIELDEELFLVLHLMIAGRPAGGREDHTLKRTLTDPRLPVDRALSRLLRKDWPRTLEELELKRGSLPPGARALACVYRIIQISYI